MAFNMVACDIITLCPQPRISIEAGLQKTFDFSPSVPRRIFWCPELYQLSIPICNPQKMSHFDVFSHMDVFFGALSVTIEHTYQLSQIISHRDVFSHLVVFSGALRCTRPLTYPSADWGRGSYPQ